MFWILFHGNTSEALWEGVKKNLIVAGMSVNGGGGLSLSATK